ncbi:hypothetical protein OUZ56_029486 [Daphnia magna]|uniref:Uncharacterized protein n=1 Tax=Daphnia magna TaxID=35525 RepID=A0ABR0B6Z0_9CRUS|nr:hypothetical protein OUZ56_029486 [Daphnia magna]
MEANTLVASFTILWLSGEEHKTEDSKARDFLAKSEDIRTTRRQPLSQRKRNEAIAKNETDFFKCVISMREFLIKSRNLTEPDLTTQNRAHSTERRTIQLTKRFLAETIKAPAVNYVSPGSPQVEPVNVPPVEQINLPPPEITPVTSRPRRVTQVPRHLSADGNSRITPPDRRTRLPCTRSR